jgi:F-type H+-transporting ATPase subunit a
MPEHQSWISIILGHAWENLTHNVQVMFAFFNGGNSIMNNEPLQLQHVVGALLVLVVVFILAFRAKSQLNQADMEGQGKLIPDKTLTARNFFELLAETVLGQMEKQMGRERAKRYFPLVASFACFILFCNFLGLIPGFLPPTDNWNTTVPLALVAFLATHIYGLKVQGLAYLKHFAGPLLPDIRKPATYPAILLVLLMIPLEIISHLIRILSLSIRLMVNLFADHLILGIFYGLFALLVPLPVMLLGILVCVIQTTVFTLLSIVYINLATEEHGHGDHGHGEHAAHAGHH